MNHKKKDNNAEVATQSSGNRADNQARPVKITIDYLDFADGSALIELGKTRVIATATIEEKVPQFLKGTGCGWVTAEYGMLPRATHSRSASGRSSSTATSCRPTAGPAWPP